MINKQISIYGDMAVQTPFNSDQLVVEISNSHIAAWVKLAAQNHIGAFELFTFNTKSDSWFDIFYAVRAQSNILNRGYIDTRIFYHFPENLVVPAHVDELNAKELFADFHGKRNTDVLFIDKFSSTKDCFLVHSITKHLFDMVNANMMMVNAKSALSILADAALKLSSTLQSDLFKVQVYQDYFSIALVVNHKLILLNSYSKADNEDVLYHLLNIAQLQQLKIAQIHLQLSGLFETKSLMIDHLSKVFSSISYDNILDSKKFHQDFDNYPEHFLTPFLNLM